MAQVSSICKLTAVSTTPVAPGKFCKLSVLDRIMESKNVRIVLYYDRPASRVAGEMSERLRGLFSEVLSIFQIVPGRLVKSPEGHWMVKCNDAGTRMVEARAKGSVVDWLKIVDREKELELVHWEDMFHNPYFWSTFYVKVKKDDI